jgi:hypothetical protein
MTDLEILGIILIIFFTCLGLSIERLIDAVSQLIAEIRSKNNG